MPPISCESVNSPPKDTSLLRRRSIVGADTPARIALKTSDSLYVVCCILCCILQCILYTVSCAVSCTVSCTVSCIPCPVCCILYVGYLAMFAICCGEGSCVSYILSLLYTAVSCCIPLYTAVYRCIPLYTSVYCYILYTAVSRCILLILLYTAISCYILLYTARCEDRACPPSLHLLHSLRGWLSSSRAVACCIRHSRCGDGSCVSRHVPSFSSWDWSWWGQGTLRLVSRWKHDI
jgi:hypothetical protein